MGSRAARIRAKPQPAKATRPLIVSLAIRLPGLTRLGFKVIFRLPHGRLRRLIAEWGMREIAMGSLTRRDFDALRVPLAPDFEVVPAPELAAIVSGENSDLRGPDAGLAFYETFLDAFRDFAFVLKEVIDFGDGRVLLLNELRGKGLRSGVAITEEEAELLEYRDGVHARLQQWRSWAEALEAVGLAE
jgi:hypothetical protein